MSLPWIRTLKSTSRSMFPFSRSQKSPQQLAPQHMNTENAAGAEPVEGREVERYSHHGLVARFALTTEVRE